MAWRSCFLRLHVIDSLSSNRLFRSPGHESLPSPKSNLCGFKCKQRSQRKLLDMSEISLTWNLESSSCSNRIVFLSRMASRISS